MELAVENKLKDSEKSLVLPEHLKDIINIGVVAYSQSNGSLGISPAYYTWAAQFGNINIVNPKSKYLDPRIDLLILPGGPDVDPLRYVDENVPVSFATQRPDPIREWFDEFVLPKYIENKTPIFGICRGHQTLAVVFGGSIIQHMWHETNEEKDRRELVHQITYINSKGGRGSLEVNSLHHQAVHTIDPEVAEIIGWYTPKTKKNLLPAYTGEREQTIEALKYRNYPIASVQWHPEEIWDTLSYELVDELLDSSHERFQKD